MLLVVKKILFYASLGATKYIIECSGFKVQ